MRVLISGGARGIGAACVKKFTSQGHSVAFIYKSAHAAAESLANECGAVAICADISKPDEARMAVTAAVSQLGGVDVLVNNAGISQIKMFCDITDSDLDAVLSTNLSSSFYVTQAALPSMVRQKWGRIITVGSVQQRKPHKDMVVYAATKSAQENMARNLAKQLAPFGITVNNVAPGVIETPRNFDALSDKEYAKQVINGIPAGYAGQPQDCAGLVLLLCSEEGGYITGAELRIDGGMALK